MEPVDQFFVTVFGNWNSIAVGHDKRSSHDLFDEFGIDQIASVTLKKIKRFKLFFNRREGAL